MAAPAIRGSTAPATGLAATAPASTAVGDAVITWERATTTAPTHTLQANYSLVRSHLHDDGSTDGRLSIAVRTAAVAGAQSYQGFTSNMSGTTRTGLIDVLRAGASSPRSFPSDGALVLWTITPR